MRTEMIGFDYPPPIVLHACFWVFVALGAVQLAVWLARGIELIRKALR